MEGKGKRYEMLKSGGKNGLKEGKGQGTKEGMERIQEMEEEITG